VLAVSVAAPALAQVAQPTTRPTRPTRGLFGSGIGETEQSLVFHASFMGGYDDDLTKDPDPLLSGPRIGRFAGGTTGLSYQAARPRVSAGAYVNASGRYYQDTSQTAVSSPNHANYRRQPIRPIWTGKNKRDKQIGPNV
jgi:hypothetical protein